jgi:OmpA-OmpF porin, OOP family
MGRVIALVLLAACSPTLSNVESAPPTTALPEDADAGVPGTRPKATRFDLVSHALRLPTPVVFPDGAVAPDPSSEQGLMHVLDYLEAKPEISLLRVEVHTGPGSGGQALSEQRSLEVARRLVALGADCQRLLPVGFGSTKPVLSSGAADRIEFVNAALRGRAIGGVPLDGGGRVAGDPCR